MAQSQFAKTPRLDALLIGKRTVPSGCRVLNVSQQGMSLRCDPDGRLLTFTSGDTVDIYLSVQHPNGHNKFTIPAIVSHVDDSTIDTVFHCTDPELAGLIESYRTSESHNLEASINHRQTGRSESTFKPVSTNENISFIDQTESTGRRSTRSFYTGLGLLFIGCLILLGAYYYILSIDRRLDALETVTRTHTKNLAEVQAQAFSSRLQDGRYASLNARMKALTDAFQSFEKRMTEALPPEPLATTALATEHPDTPSAPARETKKTAIDATERSEPRQRETVAPLPPPVARRSIVIAEQSNIADAKSSSMQKYPFIEPSPATPAATASTPPAATNEAPVATNSGKPVETDTTHTPSAAEPLPQRPALAVKPVSKPAREAGLANTNTGPWIINLLSSPDKAYVSQAMTDAQAKGFNVVIASARVKGKLYWRLQIPGFNSMAEAKKAAGPVKEKLKINDVWIFKH
jgi:hypothetical protein